MEEKKNRARRIGLIVGIIATVCIAAVLLWLFLRPEKDPGGVTIDGATEYTSGDFVLTNVHNIHNYIEISDRASYGETFGARNSATAVAPDGTVYLLAVSEFVQMEEMETISLYRLTSAGWEELDSYQVRKMRASVGHFLYLFCDSNSRVFSFFYSMWEYDIEAHMYDPGTGESSRVGDTLHAFSFYQTCGAVCSSGDKVYFACGTISAPWSNTLTFDCSDLTFTHSKFEHQGSTPLIANLFHSDGRTYLTCREQKAIGLNENDEVLYDSIVVLYCFENYGTDDQVLKYACEMQQAEIIALFSSSGCFDIQTDEDGNVYVLYCYRVIDSSVTKRYILKKVSPEGRVIYTNEYDVSSDEINRMDIAGFFWGVDGEMYLVESSCTGEENRLVLYRFVGKQYKKLEEAAQFSVEEGLSGLRFQQYGMKPEKDGWIGDVLCRNSDGWYTYLRLNMK